MLSETLQVITQVAMLVFVVGGIKNATAPGKRSRGSPAVEPGHDLCAAIPLTPSPA